jgi:Ser/Thr protein kinase RdoA (MazF antagonist)
MKLNVSYSTICEEELLLKLVPQYLAENPIFCLFWQRGSNDTYQVHCSNEIYSLRVYRHGLRSREEVDFEIAPLNYLKEHGASVAYPIAKREGGYVSEIHAPEGLRYVVMTTHAKGDEPEYCGRKHIYEEDARLFGASVAELHNLSEDFETEHKRPRLEIEHLLDRSQDIVGSFLQENSANRKIIDDMIIGLRRTLDKVPISNLDIGFCHGRNVHNDNGSLTHFDFEFCGFGFRIFELATFNWGIWDDENRSELWSSFLQGYRSTREIGTEDLALVDTFVVIRQIWWMAFIMGNVRYFGYNDATDSFFNHQLTNMKRMMSSASIGENKF